MAIGGAVYCGKCGYELTGLHHAGRCPECGHEYDMGSGKGLSSDVSRGVERGEFLMRRVRTIVLLLITLAIGAGAALGAMAMRSAEPAIWGGLFFVLFLLATVTSFAYEKSEE